MICIVVSFVGYLKMLCDRYEFYDDDKDDDIRCMTPNKKLEEIENIFLVGTAAAGKSENASYNVYDCSTCFFFVPYVEERRANKVLFIKTTTYFFLSKKKKIYLQDRR